MEHYKDILKKALEEERVSIIFPDINISSAELVEMNCYNAVVEIRDILERVGTSDREIFLGIVKVIERLKKLGIIFDTL